MTITLADPLAAQVRREAAARGVSVSAFIAAALENAIKRQPPFAAPTPFRLNTVGGNGLPPGIGLDRPRAIETAEDEADLLYRDT